MPEVQTADMARSWARRRLWRPSSGRAAAEPMRRPMSHALGVMAYQMLAGRELFESAIRSRSCTSTRRVVQRRFRRWCWIFRRAAFGPGADMLQKEQAQRPTMAAVSRRRWGWPLRWVRGARQSRVLRLPAVRRVVRQRRPSLGGKRRARIALALPMLGPWTVSSAARSRPFAAVRCAERHAAALADPVTRGTAGRRDFEATRAGGRRGRRSRPGRSDSATRSPGRSPHAAALVGGAPLA